MTGRNGTVLLVEVLLSNSRIPPQVARSQSCSASNWVMTLLCIGAKLRQAGRVGREGGERGKGKGERGGNEEQMHTGSRLCGRETTQVKVLCSKQEVANLYGASQAREDRVE